MKKQLLAFGMLFCGLSVQAATDLSSAPKFRLRPQTPVALTRWQKFKRNFCCCFMPTRLTDEQIEVLATAVGNQTRAAGKSHHVRQFKKDGAFRTTYDKETGQPVYVAQSPTKYTGSLVTIVQAPEIKYSPESDHTARAAGYSPQEVVGNPNDPVRLEDFLTHDELDMLPGVVNVK